MTDVTHFYDQRTILITGGTGFLGKVLVEKLLRSVPNVKRLYLLIRPQNNTSAGQRLENMLSSQLFDTLRQQSADVFKKLTAVDGNVTEENLGISDVDAKILVEEVSIVFHCAATIKFDEALRISVDMNVRGTERLLRFCRRMKKITVFVHASTAYANCDRTHILESIYTPPIEPQKLVDALSWMSDDMVASITPLIIGHRPNTYTYTKSLAEHVVSQESAYVPVTIVRPSIIGAIWREPLPGWTDNLNGPTGLLAAIGKGFLRTMIGDDNAIADIVPVDVVSNLLIVAAWHRANETKNCCPVINCCTGRLNSLKWGDIVENLKTYERYPLEEIYRLPNPKFTMNKFYRDLMINLNHLLPAYIFDFLGRFFGIKPRLVRIYRKLIKAVDTLEYFTAREWHFQTKMIVHLVNDLSAEDKKLFNFDVTQINWQQYIELYILGIKKYIMKEDMSNLTFARHHYRRRCLITALIEVAIGGFLYRMLMQRCKVFRRLWFYMIMVALAIYRVLPLLRTPHYNDNHHSYGDHNTSPRNRSNRDGQGHVSQHSKSNGHVNRNRHSVDYVNHTADSSAKSPPQEQH